MLKPNEIFISKGNSKLGNIPSVSLPPVVTCAAGVPCCKDCYACKLARIYKNVGETWKHNLTIYESDPDAYFEQLLKQFRLNRFFRMHVAGDIPDKYYFRRLIFTAFEAPNCEILIFTKQFSIVNSVLQEIANEDGFYYVYNVIPENLHVIFSGWKDFKPVNPYGLPESQVIFKGDTIPQDWKVCPGNCSECAANEEGCWTLDRGETIAFYKH